MLDIAPQIEQAIITHAQNKGVTVNDLLADIFAPKQKTIADMVKGKRLESFKGDPVAIQRAMRDE